MELLTADLGDGKASFYSGINIICGSKLFDTFCFLESAIEDCALSGDDISVDVGSVEVGEVVTIDFSFNSDGEGELEQFMSESNSGNILMVFMPEFDCSIAKQVYYYEAIEECAKTSQVILFTNSVPMIRGQDEIYDLDAFYWEESVTYLKDQLTPQ